VNLKSPKYTLQAFCHVQACGGYEDPPSFNVISSCTKITFEKYATFNANFSLECNKLEDGEHNKILSSTGGEA
jgi:hypothetical protein